MWHARTFFALRKNAQWALKQSPNTIDHLLKFHTRVTQICGFLRESWQFVSMKPRGPRGYGLLPRWLFECYFRRSSGIHCWLLLALLSDYFGQFVTSTFLLCKFWGLIGSTPVSFPVMRRWKCLGMKRSSQPSTTPGNGLRIVESKADVKPQRKLNLGRVCSILNQKR